MCSKDGLARVLKFKIPRSVANVYQSHVFHHARPRSRIGLRYFCTRQLDVQRVLLVPVLAPARITQATGSQRVFPNRDKPRQMCAELSLKGIAVSETTPVDARNYVPRHVRHMRSPANPRTVGRNLGCLLKRSPET